LKNENIRVSSKKSKKSTNSQEKIFTIQKYMTSNRFGDYVKKDIGIKYTLAQLEKKSDKELEDILNKIRIHLDNKNMDAIYDGMAKSMASGLEMTLTPFYDIDGFSDTLLDPNNAQFWDTYEKFKIEHKLPTMPVGLQLAYIVSSTMILQHNLNKMKHPRSQPMEDINVEKELKIIDEKLTSKRKSKPKKIIPKVKAGDII